MEREREKHSGDKYSGFRQRRDLWPRQLLEGRRTTGSSGSKGRRGHSAGLDPAGVGECEQRRHRGPDPTLLATCPSFPALIHHQLLRGLQKMNIDLHSFQPPLTPFCQQDPLFLAETSAVLASPFSCPARCACSAKATCWRGHETPGSPHNSLSVSRAAHSVISSL